MPLERVKSVILSFANADVGSNGVTPLDRPTTPRFGLVAFPNLTADVANGKETFESSRHAHGQGLDDYEPPGAFPEDQGTVSPLQSSQSFGQLQQQQQQSMHNQVGALHQSGSQQQQQQQQQGQAGTQSQSQQQQSQHGKKKWGVTTKNKDKTYAMIEEKKALAKLAAEKSNGESSTDVQSPYTLPRMKESKNPGKVAPQAATNPGASNVGKSPYQNSNAKSNNTNPGATFTVNPGGGNVLAGTRASLVYRHEIAPQQPKAKTNAASPYSTMYTSLHDNQKHYAVYYRNTPSPLLATMGPLNTTTPGQVANIPETATTRHVNKGKQQLVPSSTTLQLLPQGQPVAQQQLQMSQPLVERPPTQQQHGHDQTLKQSPYYSVKYGKRF